MRRDTGAARCARLAVRLSQEDRRRVEEAAKARGFISPSAFVRLAIRNELEGRPELTATEDRIAGSFDRVSRDIFRVGRAQQALFALFDTFVKAILTCVPEPPPDAKPQAIARARERYHTLIKTAGLNMAGDSKAALQDLVEHGKH